MLEFKKDELTHLILMIDLRGKRLEALVTVGTAIVTVFYSYNRKYITTFRKYK